MVWYALYETINGKLVSVGTVIADPLPTGLTSISLPDKPADNQMWDEVTRAFVPRPAKVLVDRLQDILTNPAYADFTTAYNALNTTNKTRLRNMLIKLLGRQRYRSQGEPTEM